MRALVVIPGAGRTPSLVQLVVDLCDRVSAGYAETWLSTEGDGDEPLGANRPYGTRTAPNLVARQRSFRVALVVRNREGVAVTVRRTLNVHRLNLPASDAKRTIGYSMAMPELTRLMADWRGYIAGSTPTGGVYVFFTDPTGGDDRRVALKFDDATFLEVN